MPRGSTRKFVAALAVLAVTIGACTSTTAGPQVKPPTDSNPQGLPNSDSVTSSSRSGPETEPTASASSVFGDAGIGDPHYPLAGNGGYQVDSYDINLSYDPESNSLQSTAHLAGTVTSAAGLTRFNLDLQSTMVVSAVTVNGAGADFSHQDAELVITPAARADRP